MADINSEESQKSIQLIKYLTKLVTNFVKYGYGKPKIDTHTRARAETTLYLQWIF